jgi:hypothetical protein
VAATGAGAFSSSETGLYAFKGWRTSLSNLIYSGIFTVSRRYNPRDVNESERMIGLASAAILDTGVKDARPYLFVAHADRIATMILSRKPFTPDQLQLLPAETDRLGFKVLLAPDQPLKRNYCALLAVQQIFLP